MASTLEKLARKLRFIYRAPIARAGGEIPELPGDGPPPEPDPVPDELAIYRNDLCGFAENILGVTPTDEQRAISQDLPGRVKIESGHSTGKAQPLSLKIDTPDGPTFFGNLDVGDRVFGADGRPVRVVAIHPQGEIQQYRVTFDDHTSTLVSGGHLWTVRGRAGRRAKHGWGRRDADGWEIATTDELIRRGLRRKNGTGSARQWEIPQQGIAQFPTRSVSIPAYSMGVWLGDGCTTNGTISSADPEIPAMMHAENGGVIRISDIPQSTAKDIYVHGFKRRLRDCGVLGTKVDQKRVPKQYKYNDAQTRLAVLQGLMDTDGTADKHGCAMFYSTSCGLAEDVAWLVRSLGGKAYIGRNPKQPTYDYKGEKRHGKLCYVVTVTLPDFPLFRLERKQSRVGSGRRINRSARMIESIEPCGTAEMQCITVDAPDGLYLTNDFIVTHNSFWMAVVALWWVYTRNPSVVICNAPTSRAVEDVLWVEIRLLWQRAKRRDLLPDYFIGPKAPEMYDTPDHWAKGYTTGRGESYQGRHRESMLFLFDEDEGIDEIYWTTTSTMYIPGGDHCWIASCNPVTTTSRSSIESRAKNLDGTPKWKMHRLSSLNHPNVIAELRGEKPPVPNAVTLAQVNQWVSDWCTQLTDPNDRRSGDVEWPPESGRFYRPGPVFQARAQGIRPSEGVDSVWSMSAWEKACSPRWNPPDLWEQKFGITIGIDTALYGDDSTALHVRCGPKSVHHESHNGWEYGQTAQRCKELCVNWAEWYNQFATFNRPPLTAYDVLVVIEFDGGYGPGVYSHRGEYTNWHGVTMSSKSDKYDPLGRPMYANLRSEMWIEAAVKAKQGQMDVSGLPPEVIQRLEEQLLPVMYEIRPDSSRMVESKDKIKERLGRSPDDADALMISHLTPVDYTPRVIGGDDLE